MLYITRKIHMRMLEIKVTGHETMWMYEAVVIFVPGAVCRIVLIHSIYAALNVQVGHVWFRIIRYQTLPIHILYRDVQQLMPIQRMIDV